MAQRRRKDGRTGAARSWVAVAIALATGLGSGCGGTGGPALGDVQVIVQGLGAHTGVGHFMLRAGGTGWPSIGGNAPVQGGISVIRLNAIPEGEAAFTFAGYHKVAAGEHNGAARPDFGVFGGQGWHCNSALALAALDLRSGLGPVLEQVQATQVSLADCLRVSASRYLLVDDYYFDPALPCAGSPSCANRASVILDGFAPNATISVQLDTGDIGIGAVGIGVWDATATPWPLPPTPGTWPTSATVTANADGDATVDVFVAPVEPPGGNGDAIVLLADDGASSGTFLFRISGRASLIAAVE